MATNVQHQPVDPGLGSDRPWRRAVAAPVGPAGNCISFPSFPFPGTPGSDLYLRTGVCFSSSLHHTSPPLPPLLYTSPCCRFPYRQRLSYYRGLCYFVAWNALLYLTLLTIPFPSDNTSPLVDESRESFDDGQSIPWIATSLDSFPPSFLREFCIVLVICRSA